MLSQRLERLTQTSEGKHQQQLSETGVSCVTLVVEIEAADLPELKIFRQNFSGYRVTDFLGHAEVLLHWPMLLEMLQMPKSRYCCTTAVRCWQSRCSLLKLLTVIPH